GVEHQAGLLVEPGLVGLAAAAEVGGPPILPDQSRGDGPPVTALPDDGGLAVIGQANGGPSAWVPAGRLQGPRHHRGHCLPDLLSIVLDPPRLRKMLAELAGGAADWVAGCIEYDRPCTGGSLVDGENMRERHGISSARSPSVQRWRGGAFNLLRKG